MTNQKAFTPALQNRRYALFAIYLLGLKGNRCCLRTSHQCRKPLLRELAAAALSLLLTCPHTGWCQGKEAQPELPWCCRYLPVRHWQPAAESGGIPWRERNCAPPRAALLLSQSWGFHPTSVFAAQCPIEIKVRCFLFEVPSWLGMKLFIRQFVCLFTDVHVLSYPTDRNSLPPKSNSVKPLEKLHMVLLPTTCPHSPWTSQQERKISPVLVYGTAQQP